jgi:hypothetical protein
MQSSVGWSGNENPVDLKSLRARLRKTNVAELRRFAPAAKIVVLARGQHGETAATGFVIQLEETRKEWKGRRVSPDSS